MGIVREASWEKHASEVESPSIEIETTLIDPIETEIEASREVLELEDNWDGEGSEGYTMVTWNAAVGLVRGLRHLASLFGQLPPPEIGPAEGGSLDLHWDLSTGSMLINVGAGANHPCTYFGQSVDGTTLAGKLELTDIRFVAAWLADR